MKPGKPSATARLIARATVFVSRDPKLGHLVSSQAVEASTWFLRATSNNPDRLLVLINRKWFRALVVCVEALTIPGAFLHYAVRKRYLEEVVREGLSHGTKQVVVLGAGFDTLCLRLSKEFPSTTFIEVDHSDTQKIKSEILRAHSGQPSNFHSIPADLSRDTLEEALHASRQYDRNSRTVFVAEGLLMYLEQEKVDGLFRFVGTQSAPGSRFAFTFLEPKSTGRVNFQRGSALIDLWLDWRGEGFRWGVRRREVDVYLETKGLKLQTTVGATELRRRFLKDMGNTRLRLARGEYIGVADN